MLSSRMIAAVVSLSSLGACSANDEPFFHWELEQSDRESIRGAQISDEKDIDTDYVVHLPGGTDVTVHVRGKVARVTFTEAGTQEVRLAPVSFELTAVDSRGYSLAVIACMGPHYQMAQPAPEDMIVSCVLKATKPNADLKANFWVRGNGKVDNGQ